MKKANANVSLQVLPLIDDYVPVVDKAIEVIAASGVKYVVGPHETTMEGDLQELMPIATKAIEECVKHNVGTVFANIKISYTPDGVLTIDEKIDKYNS